MARPLPAKADRNPAVKPLPKKPDCKSGLILICDIVDFSRKARTEQEAAVERLWQFVHDKPQQRLLGREALINGTGDGLMIACPGHQQQVDHRDFLKFADRLVEHMRKTRPRIGLRIGVHQGPFSQPQPPGSKVYQGIGTGINRCARLVAIGDGGDITVSEDFIEGWVENNGKKVREHFSPRPGRDAYAVVVKRGETMLLRFYRPGRAQNQPPPRKIHTFDKVKEHLRDHLELMAGVFQNYVMDVDPNLTPDDINVRVSIFAPTGDDGQELRPTRFRYHAKNHEVKPGDTRYSLAHSGAGPVGRAYVTNHFQCLHRLPDWELDPKGYLRLVRPTGLSRQAIVNFGRHARAFIATPFGLMPDKADGVVCLDTLSPLNSMTDADLENLADLLTSEFSATLGAFWRLRGQL